MQTSNTFIHAHQAAIAGLIDAGIGWQDLGYMSEAHFLSLVDGAAHRLAFVGDKASDDQLHVFAAVNREVSGYSFSSGWIIFCMGDGWVKLPDSFNSGITRSSITDFPKRGEWHAGFSGKLLYFCMAKTSKVCPDFSHWR